MERSFQVDVTVSRTWPTSEEAQQALPELLAELRKHGYNIERVSTYMNREDD